MRIPAGEDPGNEYLTSTTVRPLTEADIRELCEDEARRLGYTDLTDAEIHGDAPSEIADHLGLTWPEQEG
jgi:hypothetical protein